MAFLLGPDCRITSGHITMATADHAPEGEVATGMTEDQAASELLKQWGVTGDEKSRDGASPDAEDTLEGGADDQPEGDDRTDETDDEPEANESGEVEIDVAGEKFKLPPAVAEQAKRIEAKAKEVEAGATRKFQEAADLRKAAELTVTQATQQQNFNEAQAHILGEHTLVTRRLRLIEQMDLGAMAENDPLALNRINAEYNQLTAAQKRIEAHYSQAQRLFADDQKKVHGERYKAAQEFAKANIKDWGGDGGKRHAAYIQKRGIDLADMADMVIRDPRLFLILEDAEYGARIRSAKPGQEKRIADISKTLKPGAGGQSKSTAATSAQKAFDRVKRTGSVEDAALAILARSNAKRK